MHAPRPPRSDAASQPPGVSAAGCCVVVALAVPQNSASAISGSAGTRRRYKRQARRTFAKNLPTDIGSVTARASLPRSPQRRAAWAATTSGGALGKSWANRPMIQTFERTFSWPGLPRLAPIRRREAIGSASPKRSAMWTRGPAT